MRLLALRLIRPYGLMIGQGCCHSGSGVTSGSALRSFREGSVVSISKVMDLLWTLLHVH